MENTKHTVCDLFIKQVKLNKKNNSIGSIRGNKIHFISFENYLDIVSCYSMALINLGLSTHTKVAILSNTRQEWHFIDLAIMCSAGVTVPIYPSYTANEIKFIIEHSDSEILILENDEQFEKFLHIQEKLLQVKKIISIDPINSSLKAKLSTDIQFLSLEEFNRIGNIESQKNPDQFTVNIENISPDALASIVYTSGTTGEPKGAMIKHKALYQVLKNTKKYTHNSIYHKDRFLTYLPLSHVLGRLESFFPILFACEAVYAQDMKKLISHIPLIRPTLLVAVPRVLEKIYDKAMKEINNNELKKIVFNLATKSANNYFDIIDQDKTPDTRTILEYQIAKKCVFNKIYEMFGGKIRYFISGGAPLSTEINKFLRNASLTVLEGYGLTETIAPCFINPMNKQVLGSVGQPMGDVEVKFANDGEILIRSKALFSGYYKNHEETKKVLSEDGWFATGDIGIFDNQGFLKITDRKKDIIITSGGKNIAPQKIENLLKLSPYISQAMIIGNQQKYLTALISIDYEDFMDKFKEFEISQSTPLKDLVNNPNICTLIEEEIGKVNKQLSSYETIKNFRIIPVEVSVDNYLTPSLKIKKKLIHRDFAALINGMYKEK